MGRLTFRVIGAVGAATGMAAASQAVAQDIRTFDVPAQRAETGIPVFAHQAGIHILARRPLVAGKMVNTVKGSMSVERGLAKLLSGTNLTPVTSNGGAIILREQGAAPTKMAAVRPIAPSPMTITAAPQDDAAPPAEAAPPPQDIIVTGFRSSLASALSEKRNEDGVVDVIKAEDIAAFPDLNLAESLQRIPGVAITRVAGEGREISVRGLGPEYTRVRVNGMEALATSGGTDSGGAVGNNRSRGFDFNIFASELFNALTVRKTASADVEEGSLGATVDLTTGRPFDFHKPTLFVSGQLGYNDLSEKKDPRFAALFSHNFLNDRLGVLISAAYSERRILEEGHGTTQWTAAGSNGGFSPLSTLPGVTAAQLADTDPATAIFHPRNPSYNSYDNRDKRLGLTASIQMRPMDSTLVSINGMYGKLSTTHSERLLQALGFILPGTGKPDMIIRDGEVDANNNLVYGVFDNVDMRAQSGFSKSSTTFKQLTVDVDQDITDRLKFKAMIGKSQSKFADPISTTVTFDQQDIQNYVYDYRQGRLPLITFDFDPTQPSSWTANNGTSEVRLRPAWVNNSFREAKGSLTWKMADGLTFEGGVDWRRYDFASVQKRRIAGETTTQTLTQAQIADMSELYSGFGRHLDLPAGVATSWLVPDIQKYVDDLGIYSNSGIYAIDTIHNSSARGATGSVSEDDLGGYGMARFNIDLLGIGFRGDAGVRYVKTTQHSSGYAATGATIQTVTARHAYDEFLPSFNLVAEVTSKFLVRFGAAETIARPGLGSLSPGGNVSVQGINGSNRSFSTGNPYLDPTTSNNLDLSFEWYPQRGAIYSVGLFQKDIGTFVQTIRTSAPYDTLGLPDDLIAGTGAKPTDIFEVTRPVNTNGGRLRGIELNVQQPLTFLPGFLSHLGVLANYTHVSSNIEYLTSSTPGAPTVRSTLVGLSKNAANGTLYYETKRFTIRGSVAYRSGYLTQVPGRNGNFVEGTNGTVNVDAQATLNLNDHVKLTLEGLNLTDEFNDQYVDVTNRVWVYMHTGRQFYLGFRYTY